MGNIKRPFWNWKVVIVLALFSLLLTFGILALLYSKDAYDEVDLTIGSMKVFTINQIPNFQVSNGEHLTNLIYSEQVGFNVNAVFKNIGEEPTKEAVDYQCDIRLLHPGGNIEKKDFGLTSKTNVFKFGQTRTYNFSFGRELVSQPAFQAFKSLHYIIECSVNQITGIQEKNYKNNKKTFEFYVGY